MTGMCNLHQICAATVLELGGSWPAPYVTPLFSLYFIGSVLLPAPHSYSFKAFLLASTVSGLLLVSLSQCSFDTDGKPGLYKSFLWRKSHFWSYLLSPSFFIAYCISNNQAIRISLGLRNTCISVCCETENSRKPWSMSSSTLDVIPETPAQCLDH